ncbi:hypothetical protein ACSSS7_004200 [Eimeria intestinalis]
MSSRPTEQEWQARHEQHWRRKRLQGKKAILEGAGTGRIRLEGTRGGRATAGYKVVPLSFSHVRVADGSVARQQVSSGLVDQQQERASFTAEARIVAVAACSSSSSSISSKSHAVESMWAPTSSVSSSPALVTSPDKESAIIPVLRLLWRERWSLRNGDPAPVKLRLWLQQVVRAIHRPSQQQQRRNDFAAAVACAFAAAVATEQQLGQRRRFGISRPSPMHMRFDLNHITRKRYLLGHKDIKEVFGGGF